MRDTKKKSKWMKENRWGYKHHRKRVGKNRRIRTHKLIKELLEVFKSQPCVDCGVEYPHYVMDFDHVRGEKKFNLSSTKKFGSMKSLFEEVDKCDLVCANCHRIRERSKLHPSIESHNIVRRQ